MNFSLNDEQKLMIAMVRRFIAEELKPLHRAPSRGFGFVGSYG